jgi:hypothetical protein
MQARVQGFGSNRRMRLYLASIALLVSLPAFADERIVLSKPAPGAMASSDVAEAFAREELAARIDTLAPGARVEDFVIVSNDFDGDTRSVGFLQHYQGRRVVGGQVSFRFKADRLFVIGTQAVPNVRVSMPRARLAKAALYARARDGLRMQLGLPGARVTQPGDELVVRIKSDHVAVPVTIDGGADGKYLAYVDPESGAVLKTESLLRYATGTLLYRTVDRHPLHGRRNLPAARAHVAVSGSAQTTALDGTLTWTPETPQNVATAVVGDLVTMENQGPTAELASTLLAIQPGGQAIWDASANSEADAQVVTYVSLNTVIEYVRNNIDAQMKDIDKGIHAKVNIQKSCNAFYDGESVNFFAASMTCQNTGLIEDVIYHEYGHHVHGSEIIDGVGDFDGAMSEGAADFLAASITGDSGMGRGFTYTEEPLREIDPVGDEARWPEDITEIHSTGRIYSGAMWDLRKALIQQLGATAGIALANKLFVGTLRRATSIPSAFVEALAADDDNGNLADGTPHECAIRDAFGRHGLRDTSGFLEAASTLVTSDASTTVTFHITGLSARCTSDAIDKVLMIWVPNATTQQPVAGTQVLTQTAPGVFTGVLPLPKDDVVFYTARVLFADGSTMHIADNLADRYYQLYNGETVPLYCTSFDEDPFANGWRTGTSDKSPSPWKWQNGILEQAGIYPKNILTLAIMPTIDIKTKGGIWSDVHLQYKRMLAVEDSQFDKARITVNGVQAWVNRSAGRGDTSSLHHIDKEWRFHDVSLSQLVPLTKISVAFELSADGGLEFEGWAIDDLCVVANVHSICGDGVVSPAEDCDNGEDKNGERPNACRSNCVSPKCGDRIVDDKEECDDGPGGSKECTQACKSLVDEAGCCSGSRSNAWMWVVVMGLLMRRRRCAR